MFSPAPRLTVEVSLQSPVVFAGEELVALITFRNDSDRSQHFQQHARQHSSATPSSRRSSFGGAAASTHERRSSIASPTSERNGFTFSRASIDGAHTSNGRARLILGFVRPQGHFSVDPKVVDPKQFDETRRHGVLVGRHGLGYGSDNSGGWLLGGFSKLFQHDDNNERDNVPVLSTPQSLLFSDISLGPGESKQFGYVFRLPAEIPPSFTKSDMFKINYTLVIGAQREMRRGPESRTVFMPFRVFPHVSQNGDMPIHSLMHPVVVDENIGVVTELGGGAATAAGANKGHARRHSANTLFAMSKPGHKHNPEENAKHEQEFKDYIQQLLEHGVEAADPAARKPSLVPAPGTMVVAPPAATASCRENIEYFMRYHRDLEQETGRKVTSRFDIGASGSRIGVARFSRPIQRVGDTFLLVLEFDHDKTDFRCLNVGATLESTEKLTDLSLKKQMYDHTYNPGGGDVTQSTKAHAYYARSAFNTSRLSFEFTITPTANAPNFATSALSMHWGVRLDFTVQPKSRHAHLFDPAAAAESTSAMGVIAHAPYQLGHCQNITVTLPLTVYPASKDVGAVVDTARRSFML